jgi:hypothetical protein
MRVILQALSQIQLISSRLRYVNCGPGHIQCIYSSAYSDCNVHLNVSALLLEISRQFNSRILQPLCQIQRASSGLRCVNSGPAHIQYIYSPAYSGFNIQVIVSALLLVISRQRNARYTANVVPNTAHILQFTLSELRSRTYIIYLQLRIFRLQYSTERICAATGDISTVQCAMWTVFPAIYNVITAPHI